jgi:hypothetical protein
MASFPITDVFWLIKLILGSAGGQISYALLIKNGNKKIGK